MNKEIIHKEIIYKAVRSSGAGGQHVNKVATKVILSFDVQNSSGLTDEQKVILMDKWKSRISKEGIFSLESSETRSQYKNKEIITQRFFLLLELAFKKDKKRIATKIPKEVIRKRLEHKKMISDKKKSRRFRF